MDSLTPDSLREYLQAVGAQAKLVHVQAPTPTVQAAAQAVGTAVENIVKSLLFIAGGDPILVIAGGTRRVAVELLAQQLGLADNVIRMADPQEVLSATGYPVGAVPPFGHAQIITTYMDIDLLEAEFVYAGGGASDHLLQTTPTEIMQLSGADVIKLHK